ncbi:hypothetical protein ACO1NJ_14385, partial [Staphylococcus aureus]
KMIERFNDRQLTVHAAVEDKDVWINRPDGVYPEAKLWHHGYKIAGRADKVILLTNRIEEKGGAPGSNMKWVTNLRYAHIEDYKTNE